MRISLTRRAFLKASAIIGAGVSVLGPMAFSRAADAKSPKTPRAYKEWRPNICTLCPSNCGLLVQTRASGTARRALKIDGNPRDPFNQGRTCARGQSGLRLAYYPERITTPLIRVPGSKRGEWRFRSATWDEAYGYIRNKLVSNKIQPHEMGLAGGWIYAGFYTPEVTAFALSMGIPNVYATAMQPCVLGESFGEDTVIGNFITHLEMMADYENASYFISFASNASIVGISTGRALRLARGLKGMKVVVVDPRMSELAAHADEWVAIRPGTDLAMVLAMIHVVMEKDYYDHDYMTRYTDSPFLVDPQSPVPQMLMETDATTHMPTQFYVFDKIRQTVVPVPGMFGRNQTDINGVVIDPSLVVPANTMFHGKAVKTVFQVFQERVAPYTPEWAASITEIAADRIRTIAEEFGQARPALIEPGWHDGRYANSMMLRRSMAILQTLVGGIDTPGGWIEGGSYHQAMAEMTDYLDHGGDLAKYPPMGIPGIVLPVSVLSIFSDPKAWPGGFPQMATAWSAKEVREGRLPVAFPVFTNLGWDEAVNGTLTWDNKPYRMRAMWMVQANPVRNAMSAKKWENMLASPNLDLVVSIDIEPNDSNIYADVILPDQMYLEKEDEIFDLFQRHQAGIRMRVPAMDPPKQAKQGIDIMAELASQYGADWAGTLAGLRGWDAASVRSAVQNAVATGGSAVVAIQQYQLKLYAQKWHMPVRQLEQKLRTEGVLVQEEAPAVLAKWAMPEKLPAATISGRLELYSLVLSDFVTQYGYQTVWDPLVTFVPPNWKPGQGLSPSMDPNEFFFAYGKAPVESETSTISNDVLVALTNHYRDQYAGIWLNSQSARRLHIRTGDRIRLTNQISRQQADGVAYVTEMVRPDTIYMMSNYGVKNRRVFGHGIGTALSDVVPARPEPVVGAPQSGAFTVKVEKI